MVVPEARGIPLIEDGMLTEGLQESSHEVEGVRKSKRFETKDLEGF